jgi:ArsR family transcriptional regulator, lead/cadmium/zinc/bismuth-responsive transcriptional repressor
MIKEEIKQKLLNFFSSLSDETRLMILLAIAKSPKSVSEIHKSIGNSKITISAISHQLKLLRSMNIVIAKKKGKERFYELSYEYCWCILRDALRKFGYKIHIRCERCGR